MHNMTSALKKIFSALTIYILCCIYVTHSFRSKSELATLDELPEEDIVKRIYTFDIMNEGAHDPSAWSMMFWL